MTGLAVCALGIAVAALLGAAPSDAVPDDPTALSELSADDGQVTMTVPTEVPCVMLGDGSVIGPATWCIENGSDKGARLGWPSQSPEFKEAFAAERDSYASFYEYGATDEYEMFASMCRDVLMGVRGGDKAAPRCTALVEEAIQGGIPYDFTLGNAI